MTSPTEQSQAQEVKQNDKEYNFRQQEAKYEKILAQERQARLEAEKRLQELSKQPSHDDEDDSEPYVDYKKLNKKLANFGEQNKQQTKTEIQQAINQALEEERKNNWLKSNPDFYNVLEHAEKLALRDPDLAESILEMPQGFKRQQLVYKNIKALGLHQDAPKQPSIQDKIDANRRGPYYQPSGVGSAPYSNNSDFSPVGQKNAYEKMQELKNRLRI